MTVKICYIAEGMFFYFFGLGGGGGWGGTKQTYSVCTHTRAERGAYLKYHFCCMDDIPAFVSWSHISFTIFEFICFYDAGKRQEYRNNLELVCFCDI